MLKPNIDICQKSTMICVKCKGRLNFQYTGDFSLYVKELNIAKINKVIIDLKECEGMDSTFMGVLCSLGLKAMKSKIPAIIYNANKNNTYLLDGLGLSPLFKFENGDTDYFEKISDFSSKETDKIKLAEAIIQAHETLEDVDPANIPKFENVIKYTKEDLEKMKSNLD